jgi:hypothetical protein
MNRRPMRLGLSLAERRAHARRCFRPGTGTWQGCPHRNGNRHSTKRISNRYISPMGADAQRSREAMLPGGRSRSSNRCRCREPVFDAMSDMPRRVLLPDHRRHVRRGCAVGRRAHYSIHQRVPLVSSCTTCSVPARWVTGNERIRRDRTRPTTGEGSTDQGCCPHIVILHIVEMLVPASPLDFGVIRGLVRIGLCDSIGVLSSGYRKWPWSTSVPCWVCCDRRGTTGTPHWRKGAAGRDL